MTLKQITFPSWNQSQREISYGEKWSGKYNVAGFGDGERRTKDKECRKRLEVRKGKQEGSPVEPCPHLDLSPVRH